MGQLQLRKSKRDESACVHKYGKDGDEKSAGEARSKSRARGIEKRSAGPDDEGDFDEFMRSIRRAGSGIEC